MCVTLSYMSGSIVPGNTEKRSTTISGCRVPKLVMRLHEDLGDAARRQVVQLVP